MDSLPDLTQAGDILTGLKKIFLCGGCAPNQRNSKTTLRLSSSILSPSFTRSVDDQFAQLALIGNGGNAASSLRRRGLNAARTETPQTPQPKIRILVSLSFARHPMSSAMQWESDVIFVHTLQDLWDLGTAQLQRRKRRSQVLSAQVPSVAGQQDQ